MRIKVGDTVEVICGNDRKKRGKVLRVDREKQKVVVEGVNKVLKHMRRSQRNPQGGRLSKEMPLPVSNVMLVCPSSGKPTRVGVRLAANGTKERFAKVSGATISTLSVAKKSAK